MAFAEVLAAARHGAPPAFERLFAGIAPAVAGYLRMQGAPDPEDLTSEVFLRVFGEIGTFHGSERQFRSWVFTIAHRRLPYQRDRIPRQHRLADTGQEAPGEQWVIGLCGRLTADQRTVLLLRVVGDLAAEDVARVTGQSVATVETLQRRALDTLRRQLATEGVPL